MSVENLPLPRFVVFGEALTDLVRTGEQTWHSAAGGACWNVARVGATLGTPTAWAGAVSTEFFGQDIVSKSQAAGLDLRFLQEVAKPPLLAIVYQTHPPLYSFLGNDSADLAFDEERLPSGWQGACEVAHFGCISLVRRPLGDKLQSIANELKRRGVRISYDPNYRNLMGPDFPSQFEQMARLASIIKVSDEDLRQIYPGLAHDDALANVRRLAPAALILDTRGEHGIVLHGPFGTLRQAAFAVPVVDTVGAGDACVGGFIASWLNYPQRDLAAHLRFAAATAAAACTRPGAHAPTAREVARVLGDLP